MCLILKVAKSDKSLHPSKQYIQYCSVYTLCKRPRSYSIEKAVNKHFEHGRENCLPSASYWQVLNWTGIDVPARKIDQNIPIFGRLKGLPLCGACLKVLTQAGGQLKEFFPAKFDTKQLVDNQRGVCRLCAVLVSAESEAVLC